VGAQRFASSVSIFALDDVEIGRAFMLETDFPTLVDQEGTGRPRIPPYISPSWSSPITTG
jgi:hypothetical protein